MKLPEYITCPVSALPKKGSQADQYLIELIVNEQVDESKFAEMFNSNQRSPLQKLRGPIWQYWRILDVTCPKTGNIIARKLDPRHKSGDENLDRQARKEREREYTRDSLKQALDEIKRLPKAQGMYLNAREE